MSEAVLAAPDEADSAYQTGARIFRTYTTPAAADPFAACVVHGEDLAAFVAGKRPITGATAELPPVPPGVFAASADRPGTPAWRR